MTKTELKTVFLLAGIYCTRMLGLFLIFPTFSLLAKDLPNATPLTIGLALGIYSLAQAVLQIPAGILSDVIGRKKVLYTGLLLFLLGSLVAALSDSIYGIIIGRLLQGMGAVSAVCLAYIADSVRDSEYSKAMAVIGVSIACSFALSFVIGSLLSTHWGLDGLFFFTAGLTILAMLFAFALPKPQQSLTVFKLSDFVHVATDSRLLFINIQVALLHMTLSASFFLIPLLLKDYLADANIVVLYVFPIIIAFVLVMPAIKKGGEKGANMLPIFWGVFSVALLCFAIFPTFQVAWLFMLVLGGFFFAFTFVEAILPSQLLKTAKNTSRGATSGVFSVYQFSGNFLGGLVGAKLYTHFSENATISNSFYVLACIVTVISVTLFVKQKNKTNKK